MSDYVSNKNVSETYLRHSSPEKVYEWVSEHLLEDSSLDIEIVLVERDHPLIDLSLARFGRLRRTLSTVYRRGDIGVRCAALGNPATCKEYWRSEYNTWLTNDILFEILENDDGAEFEAFFTNEFLHREFLISILDRKKPYDDIPDETFLKILLALARNKRMSAPVPTNLYDGWTEFRYNQVYSSAWNLAVTLPADEKNTKTLAKFLKACNLPVGLGVSPLLKRWSLTEPLDDKGLVVFSDDFDLRERLADNLKPDEMLLKSEDPACRASFYRRFLPHEFPDWPKFVETEKAMFSDNEPVSWLMMVHNENLWKTENLRDTLSNVAWSIPDPRSDMRAPAVYSDVRDDYFEKCPEWFADEQLDTGVLSLEDKVDRIMNSFGLIHDSDIKYSNLREVPARISEIEDNLTVGIQNVDRFKRSVDSTYSSLKLKVTDIDRKLETLTEQLSARNEVDNRKTWPVPHWFWISIICIMVLELFT